MPPAQPPAFNETDTVWIWDPVRARIIWATAAAAAFWGERNVADLSNRPFLADDPNARALNDLASAPPPEGLENGQDDREAEITLFPDGAPVRVQCRARVRRRSGGGIWLAVHASPAPEIAESPAAREAALLDGAESAFALIDDGGGLRFLNPAARRLFNVAPEDDLGQVDVFQRYRAPDRARRAARAAALRGAFSHTVDLEPPSPDEPPLRALIVYRRVHDPLTGEPLLSLEASPRPGEAAIEAAALKEVVAGVDGGRIGVALFDAATATLREASAAAAALIGRDRARRGATLADLFPEKAAALAAALDALRSGEPPQSLDLPIDSAAGRGPWSAARLSLALGEGPPTLVLALADLGPERRMLLLRDQERRAEEGALAGLGVGLLFADDAGRVRRADPTGAAALGLEPGEAEAALEEGIDLPGRLSAPWGERLAERLTALFNADQTDPPPADPAVEATLTGVDGRTRLVRLSVSAPFAFGKRLVCVALDQSPSAAAPHAIPALTAPIVDARAAQAADHAFRTALTTIKGFAELARDHPGDPAQQRRRLKDIVDTAEALTLLVERSLGAARSDAPLHNSDTEIIDLSEVAAAAAARSAGRHPAWLAAAVEGALCATRREDLDEALDILIAEAADRGPARLSVEATERGGAASSMLVIEVSPQGAAWAPMVLRAAELLIQRAGGQMVLDSAESGAEDGVARFKILFAAVA